MANTPTGRAGGDESWIPPVDEEVDEDRPYWKCSKCPVDEACKTFHKSNCISFVDEDRCRYFVQQHLQFSGNHNLMEGSAQGLAAEATVNEFVQTREERDKYRDEIEKIAAKKRSWTWEEEGGSWWEEEGGWCDESRKKGKGKGKGGDKGKKCKGKDKADKSGIQEDIRQMNNSIGQLANIVAGAVLPPQASGSRQGGAQLALGNVGDRGLLRLDPDQLIMRDRCERILEALGNTQAVLIQTARTLNDEGGRIKEIMRKFD